VKIIKRWEALVEEITRERVHLRLFDLAVVENTSGDEVYLDSSHFQGVELADGVILSVLLYDDRTLKVENIPSQYDPEKSKIVYEEFSAAVAKFR
jgi:hypothetical protein